MRISDALPECRSMEPNKRLAKRPVPWPGTRRRGGAEPPPSISRASAFDATIQGALGLLLHDKVRIELPVVSRELKI